MVLSAYFLTPCFQKEILRKFELENMPPSTLCSISNMKTTTLTYIGICKYIKIFTIIKSVKID